MKLNQDFYLRDDVLAVSRELLGKVLCTSIDGQLTTAVITETEAYAGVTDKASHAYGDRRTKRTEPIYGLGGHAYVYLCYGIHHLFNVVSNIADVPHAILIRAGVPADGVDHILRRRRKRIIDKKLLGGPGTLAQGLGITTALTATSLIDGPIWIEDRGLSVSDDAIVIGARVGIDYAQEDASRPYRFRIDPQLLDEWYESTVRFPKTA